jgi:DNA-binding beta-propeller fold protein YncE
MKPVAIACLSIFALSTAAACSGGGSVPSTPSAFAGKTAAAPDRLKHRKGRARIRIRIPHKKKHGRHERYISPATKSIKIVVGGTTTIVANLTPNSPNCIERNPTYTQCVVTVSSLLGPVDFSFTTYDAVNAGGNKLSANDVTFDVVNGATTPLSVTLGGIASSISFTPTTTVPAVTGSQAAGYKLYGKIAQSFTVVPMDADDFAIIGPGAPTVTITAPPAAQKLGVATPAPATPNEWKLLSSYTATNPLTPLAATVTAVMTPVPGSGGPSISAPVNFSLYQPWIYVTDEEDGTLYVFDEQGNQITLGSNAWVGIPSPTGISFDPHNNQLYMAGFGDGVVYQTDVLGNLVSPSPGAWSQMAEPATARYVPTNNRIYVPNQTSLPTSPSPLPPGVTAYDENGAQQTVSGSMSTQYGTDLAFNSANGLLYLAGGGLTVPAVLAYDVNGNPQTVGGNYGGLSQANSLGYDSNNGYLYVGSVPTSSIGVYDAQGNPISTTGTFPGLSTPNGIVYDPYNGLIYVADGGGNNPSNVFAFDEQGNPQPITFTISGDSFDQAWGVAVVP